MAIADILYKDPAHAINQLRLLYEEPPEPILQSGTETHPTASTPLPWEAVIPAGLMSASVSRVSSSPPNEATGIEASRSTLPTTPLSKHDLSAPGTRDVPAVDCSRRRKAKKFLGCLDKPNVDVAELRKLAWSGIPDDFRPMVWQILLGYLPAPAERRVAVLARKRQEYSDAVRLAFGKGQSGLDQTIWHQIHIDVPRTNPGVALWQFPATQRVSS